MFDAAGSAASRERPEDDDNVRAFTVETFAGDRSLWHLCAVRGVVGATAFSLAYMSLTYLTVGFGGHLFLNIFGSILVAVGESVSAVEAAAILFGLVGTLLIVSPALFGAIVGRETTPPDTVGVVIILLGAVLFRGDDHGRYRQRVSPLNLATWFHGTLSSARRLPSRAGPRARDAQPIRVEPSGGDQLHELRGTAVAQLRIFPPPALRPRCYLLVVWSALLGVAVMGEGMDTFGACGAAVICLGGLSPSVNKAGFDERTEVEGGK